MPTFTHQGTLAWYAIWNLCAFLGAFLLNSFIEYGAHRLIMHRRFPLLPYGYEHTTSHHAKFGADETYHAGEEWLKKHILFTWREYVLFPVFCLAIYAPLELALNRPILAGALAATFMGLQMFNSLHYWFHCPSDTWFQRTKFFLALKGHHRRHHADMTKNFNVYFFPIGDLCFRTYAPPKPESLHAKGGQAL